MLTLKPMDVPRMTFGGTCILKYLIKKRCLQIMRDFFFIITLIFLKDILPGRSISYAINFHIKELTQELVFVYIVLFFSCVHFSY